MSRARWWHAFLGSALLVYWVPFRALAAESFAAEDGAQSLDEILATKVDVILRNVPLKKSLEQLARKHHFELRFEMAEIEDQRIPLDRHISITLHGIELKSALIRMLKPFGLAMRVKGKTVVIGRMPPQRVAKGQAQPPPQPRGIVLPQGDFIQRAIRVAGNRIEIHVEPFAADDERETRDDESIENRLREYASKMFFETVGAAGSRDALREHLENLLESRIESEHLDIGLSNSQRDKLRLAGSGDIERIIERVDDQLVIFLKECTFDGPRLVIGYESLLAIRNLGMELTKQPLSPDSMFEKQLRRLLRASQTTVRSAVRYLRGIGGYTRAHGSDAAGASEAHLASCPVDDFGLLQISRLTGLEVLTLNATPVTDDSLRHLSHLTQLRSLDLSDTKVGDKGLAQLAGLKNLEQLNLSNTAISDPGLTVLGELVHLKSLNLAGTSCTDGGLAHLRSLEKLEELDLESLEVSDAGLRQMGIDRMVRLRELRLANTSIGDKSLQQLAELSHLETLDLEGTKLTGAGLTHLQRLPALRILNLSGTGVTDDDLRHLSALPILAHLALRRTNISDRGLVPLRELTRLRTLDVTKTDVSNAGAAELQAKISLLKVSR